jgi:excisionase family DNA binding protein
MARELLSAGDTGEVFHVHAETLRRLYRARRIPGYKVGRFLRFDVDEVREALRATPDSARAVEPDFEAI